MIKNNPSCEYFQWNIKDGEVKIERCNHEASETGKCNVKDCPIDKEVK